MAPQLPILIRNNSQFLTKPVALQSLQCRKLLPFVPQLAPTNSTADPYLNTSFALQMPSKFLKPQIVPNNPTENKSHSFNKIAANALQNSDDKECEQSEQLYPIKPVFGIKSTNQHKYLKLSAKTQSIRIRITQSIQLLKCIEQRPINLLQRRPESLSRTILLPHRLQILLRNTETTPSGSVVDTAEDLRFTDTLNKVSNRKLLAILAGKDAILKELHDCVLRDDPDKLKEISPYVFSYWGGS